MTLAPVAPWGVVVAVATGGLVGCLLAGRHSTRRSTWLRRGAIVALFTLVAIRPGSERADADVVISDLDVFFVVDRTGSMVAEDHGEGATRLDGVRADVLALAAGLPGARWSLVGFDDDVTSLVPLITDATAFREAVDRLRPEVQTYSSGSSPRLPVTALTGLLADAAEQEPGRRRLVFLFTDGEATAERPQSDSFAAVADGSDGGAVLGYGTPEGAPMRVWTAAGPTDTYIVDARSGVDAISRIDPTALAAIADELDVPMLDRTAGDPLSGALDGIDEGQTRTSSTELPVHQDRGWWWAIPLFVLVLWEVAALTTDVAAVVPARRRTTGGR